MQIFKLFHSIFRRNMRPVPKDEAMIWRERLSKIYLFLAFNCLGVVIFASYKYDLDLVPHEEGKTNAQRYRKLLRGDNTHVIQFKGLKITDQYELTESGERKE